MANVSSSNSQKALVPKLRFPGFEGEWRSVKLSDMAVFRKNRGQTNKAHFVSTENMKQNCAGIEVYPDTEYAEGIKFQEADILIANIRPYLKKAWLATFSGACSADVLALCPVDILPSFLFSVIGRDSFFDYVMSGAKGSKMPRGDKTHIMTYTSGVPGCEEQKRISDMMALLDKRIDAQRRLVESLKSYKRGVTKAIFNPNSVYQNCAESWRLRKVSELLSYEQPQKYIVQTEHYSSNYATPVLTANKGFILGYTNETTGVYDKGDVVIYDDFTMDMKYVDFPFKVKSSTIKFLTAKPGNNLYFLFCLLQSLSLTPEGHQRSYISKVEQMNVFVPSVDEQSRIAGILKKVTVILERHEFALHKLEMLKAGLLNQLFI